jgi:glutathione S-transferase
LKLYWFWSFNPQKVRCALEELGLDHELIEVDLGKGEQRSEAYRAMNPHGQVPAIDDDGYKLAQSNAIIAYLGEREGRLWPDTAKGRGEAMRWLFFEATALVSCVGPIWFNEIIAPRRNIQTDPNRIQRARTEIERPLGVLEQHLQQYDYLLGEFSLVDCAVGVVLAALDITSYDLGDYPGIRAYLLCLRARPAWTRSQIGAVIPR